MNKIILIAVMLGTLTACASTTKQQQQAEPPVSAPIDRTKISEGYLQKGIAYFQAEKYELALSEMHKSVKENTKNKDAYQALGVTYFKLGKLDEAEKYYREAIDIDDTYSDAYNGLGVVYSLQQKWKDAQKNFLKALDNKMYPGRAMVYSNMGDMFMNQKEPVKAAESYRESKRYEKIDFIIIKLGDALLESGKPKDAIKEYQEAASMSLGNPLFRYKLAIAFLKDGNKTAAVAEFNKVIELAPASENAKQARDYLRTLR